MIYLKQPSVFRTKIFFSILFQASSTRQSIDKKTEFFNSRTTECTCLKKKWKEKKSSVSKLGRRYLIYLPPQDSTGTNSKEIPAVPVGVCARMCTRVGACTFSLFSLVLLDWLGFTWKVADHLRQRGWSNRVSVKRPASTSIAQNVDYASDTPVCCPGRPYPFAMAWLIPRKIKE